MIAKKSATLVVIAACAIALPLLASIKNPVTRPLRIQGHCTVVVDLSSGEYELTEWGEATHMGRYLNTGSGDMNVATGVLRSGHGTAVGPDGSTLDWHFVEPLHAVFENGTGRFQGATAWQRSTITWQGEPVINEQDGTMTFQFNHIAIGQVTY